jgi:hypothetical protein
MSDRDRSDKATVQPPSHLFTVRIWSEVSVEGTVTWRGKVQHVPNGAWRYFQTWAALTNFLQNQVEELVSNP